MRTLLAPTLLVLAAGCNARAPGPPQPSGNPAGQDPSAEFGFMVRWPGPVEEAVEPVGGYYERRYTGVHKRGGDRGEAVYSVTVFEFTADELRQTTEAERRDLHLRVYLDRSSEVTRADLAFGPGKLPASDLRYRKDDTHVRRRVVFAGKRPRCSGVPGRLCSTGIPAARRAGCGVGGGTGAV